MKTDIRSLELSQLSEQFKLLELPAFRARQVHEWLWKKSATDFEQMTNLSLELRKALSEQYSINAISTDHSQYSQDGTIKNRFKLFDGHFIEGVLIPADDRMTACVSSQVGCSLACKFCATGYLDRERNLNPDEIYDQVVELNRQAIKHFELPLSNIVFMGMGEPLLNYGNVLKSIERITSPDGLGMSPRRITVSTAGVAKMIKKLADDEVKFNLALSLHAANDTKRDQIMNINASNNLEALAEALKYFHAKTGTRITFEYIVFHNFNDSVEDARELAEFCKNVPCKVNIIEYNPIAEADFKNTGEDRLEAFAGFLERRNIIVNIRRSRGKDIDAACGQLANKGEG